MPKKAQPPPSSGATNVRKKNVAQGAKKGGDPAGQQQGKRPHVSSRPVTPINTSRRDKQVASVPRSKPGPQRTGPRRVDTRATNVTMSNAASRGTKVRVGGSNHSGGIPRSTVVKGLRMPKDSGAYAIQSRLKNKSPWYQSILNPLKGADVKIPDATGVETGTLQMVQRVPLQAITGDVGSWTGCGIRTTCLHPNAGTTNASDNFQTIGDLGVEGQPIWGPLKEFDAAETLKTYSQGVRVVSAALYVQSLASLSENSGEITAYLRPYPAVLYVDGNELETYQNTYKASIIPVNLNKPAMVRWYPVKDNGAEYDMFYLPTQTAGPGYENDGPEVPFWEMGFIITGCPSGTQFEVMIVVNYEFIPLTNAINILDASPSPVDAQEVDMVETWVQDMSPSGMTSNNNVSSPPQVSEVEEPGFGTGFGFLAEIFKEIAPIALALL